ncbi:MAG: hypothetical protein WCV93_03985 [Candidatus Shapirobacteria bacterium]|jgi:hypothetical protein
MYPQPTKVHQKLISFPDPIYTRLLERSKKSGFSFSEYIRMMSFLHLREPEPFEEVEVLDAKTSKEVEASLKEFREGRYHTFKTMSEFKKYFDKL